MDVVFKYVRRAIEGGKGVWQMRVSFVIVKLFYNEYSNVVLVYMLDVNCYAGCWWGFLFVYDNTLDWNK